MARMNERGRERSRRAPLMRALAAVSAGALATGALAAVNGASAPSPQSAAISAPTPTQAAPMAPARAHAHRITRATIGLFTATPAQLPAAGGRVRLVAVVAGATRCRFSSTKHISRLPVSRSCASGTVSMTVTLPKNTSASARSFRFQMTARASHSSTTAAPVLVTERAPVSPHAAPQITTQPTGRSVVAGSTVSFTAAASGSPKVRWQVSSDAGQHWSNVAGATSGTYSFTAVIADSGREYRAGFTNSAGSTNSDPAMLTVTSASAPVANAPAQVAPGVMMQPASVAVSTGAVATFTAAASGSPVPDVQWQVSTDGGASWSAIPGATGASYALTAQLSQSGYQYRAVFSNAAGSATTNAAALTVSQGPSITSQPTSQSVVVGSMVSFSAAAAGTPAPSVQWQVSSDGGQSWTPIAGATATTYSFTPQSGDSGKQYEALFSNAAGAVASAAATLTVTLTPQAPAVTLQPTSRTGVSGTSVTFTAGASGSPTPAVQWQQSTDGGVSWSNVASGGTSTTYTFTAAQSENAFEYHAVFSNGVGASATTNAATLTVQTAPAITAQPSTSSVVAGSSASFSASASGVPAPTVQWQVSANGGGNWSNVAGATSTTYSFTTTTAQNGNQYRAVFTNPAGAATTNAAALTVSPAPTPPQITGQPSNRAVLVNTTVNFSASASGSPTPTVQWMVSMNNGASWSMVAGATSTLLSFTATAGQNGFKYEAVFTNSGGGATTSAATLVVGSDASSKNWSGYDATAAAGSFTAVSGTWNVPTANCQSATTFASEWVGIDGDGSATVEQDGTDADCSSGDPVYYAWYETFGAANTNPPAANGNSVTISGFPVDPGDSMTGTVTVSGTTFTLAITDNTSGQHFSIPETWSVPQRSSAEWIVERPTVNGSLASLTNFGAVGFSSATATTTGLPQSISVLGGHAIEMTNNATTTLLALPGPLTPSGDGFTDTFYASS